MPRDPQFVAYVTEKSKSWKHSSPPTCFAAGDRRARHRLSKRNRPELQGHGLMICWKATLDSSDPDNCSVRIEVFQPKANLSPEDQRIYDEWFCRVNGLPPPS